MALTPPTPGLRRLFNGSKSTIRAEIQVPPGHELEVSDVVAEQLQRAGFKAAEAEPVADEAKPAKRPAKKAAAKD